MRLRKYVGVRQDGRNVFAAVLKHSVSTKAFGFGLTIAEQP